jgi:hypothetical protein
MDDITAHLWENKLLYSEHLFKVLAMYFLGGKQVYNWAMKEWSKHKKRAK